MTTEASAAIASDRAALPTTPRETVPWLPSGVRFVSDDARRALLDEAVRCRFVVVDVVDDPRRSLRDAVEDGVETALAHRGALPPATPVGATAARVVRDQHARLRASSARGIVLALPSLAGRIEDGALPVDDGQTIAGWMRLALDDAAPTVVLAVRHADRMVPVLVPRSIAQVVDEADGDLPHLVASVPVRIVPALAPTALPPPVLRAEAIVEASVVEPDALLTALETSAPPAPVVSEPAAPAAESVAPPADVALAADPADDDPWAHADDVIAARATPADLGPLDPPEELPTHDRALAEAVIPAAARLADAPLDDDDGGLGLDDASLAPAARPLRDLRDVFDEALRVDAPPAARATPSCERPVERSADATPRSRERAAQRVASAAGFRAHALELEAARGPKPLAVVHDLFATHYVPLLGAMARGELDGAVRGIVEDWRQSFASSYQHAFASMRVTGKRPPMVLDVPEAAAKLARASGAKTVKLVLVDAMGWDLGRRVSARMGATLGSRASLVEQQMLWSALPTITPVQSFYLARGPNGLRDQEPPPSEPDVSRGRNVSSLRRERIGSRDVMKLDLVEARLRSPGDGYDERLEAIAEETSQVVSRFAETLPARTLLYVFGDHGFVLPPGGSGFLTGAATQGGASPEEVLVGGFAWMIDAVH